jgi:ribonuclease HII
MTKYVVGVDEAGCGALAGPLVVVAAAFAADAERVSTTWKGLRADKTLVAGDSKGIKDAAQRAHLAEAIRKAAVTVSMIERQAAEIDARLFSVVFPESIRLAASRCVEALTVMDPTLSPSDILVLIDGDLERPDIPCPVQCIPDGDKLDWRIGAASVLAKAKHDVWINQIHEAYPKWGFDSHRGYPTKAHKDLLMKRGPVDVHRKSFRPVMAAMPRAKGIEE